MATAARPPSKCAVLQCAPLQCAPLYFYCLPFLATVRIAQTSAGTGSPSSTYLPQPTLPTTVPTLLACIFWKVFSLLLLFPARWASGWPSLRWYIWCGLDGGATQALAGGVGLALGSLVCETALCDPGWREVGEEKKMLKVNSCSGPDLGSECTQQGLAWPTVAGSSDKTGGWLVVCVPHGPSNAKAPNSAHINTGALFKLPSKNTKVRSKTSLQ